MDRPAAIAATDEVSAARASAPAANGTAALATQVISQGRYRIEVVTRGLLAPAAVGCSLSWMYRLFVLPLVGRALLRPHERGTPALLRAFGLGRIRRDDPHFGGCGRYGGVALPPLRSAPYVSAAYQPGPMCRPYSGPLLRLSVPGPVVARASGHACTGRPFGRRRWAVSRGLAAVEISRSRRHAAEKGGVS